jgi:excisionase family DNA binding protein
VASGERLGLGQVADRLGVHYMTAYRYVRTGRLPAEWDGHQWRVRARDLERMRRGGSTPAQPSFGHGATGRGARSGKAVEQLAERMLDGDHAGAWQVVEARLARGMDASEVLVDLVAPALRAIGDGWSSGRLSVADEHKATAIALRLEGRLSLQFARRGQRRGSVVVAAPAGELHTIPVAIAADLLRWSGFRVVELGAYTPPAAVAEAAASAPRLIAVAIGATTPGLEVATSEAIAAVHARCPGVPVVLGGAAVRDAAKARELGADAFSEGSAPALVEVVKELEAAGRQESAPGRGSGEEPRPDGDGRVPDAPRGGRPGGRSRPTPGE